MILNNYLIYYYIFNVNKAILKDILPNGFPKAFGQVGFVILVWPTITETPGRDYPKYTPLH